MFPDWMRASDEDRQRVVDALQEQTGQGRLSLQEFDQRSTDAYAAITLGELRKLISDLPIDVLPLGAISNTPYSNHLSRSAADPMSITRQSLSPRMRRMLTVATVVLLVMVVAGTATSIAMHTFFLPLPLLILGFVLLRGSRGRGPGYRH